MTYDLYGQPERSWNNMHCHSHLEGHQNPVLAHFDRELRLIVFLLSTVVSDERTSWSYHQIWRHIVKWIGQGRVGNANFRRQWYKVWLSSPSRSQVIDENLISHFGCHAPLTLCHGFSKSTSWSVEWYV